MRIGGNNYVPTALPSEPSLHRPGTDERVAEMQQREDAGQSLYHPADRRLSDEYRPQTELPGSRTGRFYDDFDDEGYDFTGLDEKLRHIDDLLARVRSRRGDQ
jgi:hypothetical protein